MEFVISVMENYSIEIERLSEEGISFEKKSVRKYIFLVDENYQRLMPIINSLPAECREENLPKEAAPPAAFEPGLFDASVYSSSNRIRQILMVLSAVYQNRNEISDTKTNIAKSIKYVSNKLEVDASTIYDKILRIRGEKRMNMNDFSVMVAKWLENNEFDDLYAFLKDSCSVQNKRVLDADLLAVTEFKKTIS